MRYLIPFCLIFASTNFAETPSKQGLEYFEKNIRPLFVKNCYRCHGEKKQRGGLRLDGRSLILKGGDSGPALVPGHPEKSRLIHAIEYADTELKMPPKGKLKATEIQKLIAWVKMGAPAPDGSSAPATKVFDLEKRRKSHWAFHPLNPGEIPEVKDHAWSRSPIDRYILAMLESKGLTPNPQTDRRSWLRRVTYSLIGLPPTRQEIDSFLNDDSPQAYERVVDRLLASPHYGERWARHWLDLVRFAETAGHEFDFEIPQAFEYRDYVIRALNSDLPYDQFVMEHVAGDLLENPRRHPLTGINESVIGTGFFHLGEGKHSPVDIREEEASRVDNQIDVFSKTFLGLTVSCARCHDHKFDAISTKDYYALFGYIRSSRYHLADINPPEPTQSILKEMRQVHDRLNQLAINRTKKSIQEQAKKLPQLLLDGFLDQEMARVNPSEGTHWLAAWKALGSSKQKLTAQQFQERCQSLIQEWKRRQNAKESSTVFADFEKEGYEKWFTTGPAFGTAPGTAKDVAVNLNQTIPVTKIRGANQAHSGLLGNRLQGTFRSPTFIIDSRRISLLVAGQKTKINLIIDGFQRIRSPIYGGLTLPINSGERMTWRSIDVSMWKGERAYIECLDQGNGWMSLKKVVFSDGALPPEKPSASLIQLLDDNKLTSREQLATKYQEWVNDLTQKWSDAPMLDQMLTSSAWKRGRLRRGRLRQSTLRELTQKLRELEGRLPTPRRALSLVDGTGQNEKVFIRGNHKNPGEVVPRRFLEAIAGKDQNLPKRGSGRLTLARRMIDSSNPLLSRVIVNRLWHHHFGQGIVASPDDFGVQGQKPSHPQLLDWLATELVRQKWSLKKIHRLMVLSSTYRQSSRETEAGRELDPENVLLHRMPIRRLEAEAIRDSLLKISGRADNRMYGRGTMPHLTAHMTGRGRPRRSGPLDGEGRRSIYINVRRNFLTPFFLAFDYPQPFTTIGKRSVSNVPAQALSMMNNPFVKQQTELWAQRALRSKDQSAQQRVQRLYLDAFGRLPSDAEMEFALEFLKQQGNLDDARVWSELCHVLVNVKEFIFLR